MTNHLASATLSLFAAIFTDDTPYQFNLKEAAKIEEAMDRDYGMRDILGTYRVKPYRTKKPIKLKDVDQWPKDEGDQLDTAIQRLKTCPVSAIIPPRIVCYARVDRDYDQVDLEVLIGKEAQNTVYSMTIRQWEAIRPGFTKLKDTKVYGSEAEGVANLAIKR